MLYFKNNRINLYEFNPKKIVPLHGFCVLVVDNTIREDSSSR
jgi:hypothetical protein